MYIFEKMDEKWSTEIGIYTATLLLTLWQKWMVENISNNISSREFSFTEDLYSLDGIDVYSDS